MASEEDADGQVADRPRRAAGQGDAHRHDDQAAAGGGAGRAARRRQPQQAAGDPQDEHPRAGGRACAGAARRTGAADTAVHRGRRPVRRRTANRAGAVGWLAGGAVPRHPDRAVRPADGRPPAAGADASGCAAARHQRTRTTAAVPRPPGPGSTCNSEEFGDSPFQTAHRDAQRVGGVPHLRRQGALAEEGFPRQGRRHDRPQRVQCRGHRGAAGRHHVAGTRRPGGSGRAQRRGEVDAAAPAVGDLRADARRRDRDRPGGTRIRPRRRHGPGDIGLREHHHPRPVPGSDPQADGWPRSTR